MKYILLFKDRVTEIIPDEDPRFPGFPIEDRYSPEFLKGCIAVSGDTVAPIGYIYDVDTGAFTEPPIPTPPIPVPPESPTATELIQQDITDLQLDDLSQGQEITDLWLTVLGG